MDWGLWEQTVAVASVWVISLITIYENKENKYFHFDDFFFFLVWKTFNFTFKNIFIILSVFILEA